MNFFKDLLKTISGISLNNKYVIFLLYFYLDLDHAGTELHEVVMVFHECSQRENKVCAFDFLKEHVDTSWSFVVREVRSATTFHELLNFYGAEFI